MPTLSSAAGPPAAEAGLRVEDVIAVLPLPPCEPTLGRDGGKGRISSVGSSLLPLAALQTEIAEQNGGEQERHHRDRDGRALAELSARNGALEAQGRHQVGGIERAAAGQHV